MALGHVGGARVALVCVGRQAGRCKEEGNFVLHERMIPFYDHQIVSTLATGVAGQFTIGQPSIHGRNRTRQISTLQQVLAGRYFRLPTADRGLCQCAARRMLHHTQQQRARAMGGGRPHPFPIDGLPLDGWTARW